MTCARCSSENPEVAYYCHRCGDSLKGIEGGVVGKRTSFAVQPGENVTQFALISTLMPGTNRNTADNYRWSLIITAIVTLAFTTSGLLPAAIIAAAFLVPATYLVYLYDTNTWEEAPAAVVAMLFLLTGVLASVVSLLFFNFLFDAEFATLLTSTGSRGGLGSLPLGSLLIFAVVLPIVAEVVKNIGPVLLARRPAFDDMIDGFTFGVAAGTAYAAFETVVAFGPVFTSPDVYTSTGLGAWVVVILNVMIVKSVIYGSATGIAVAAFSGLGEGYAGLSRRYYSAFGLAVGANIAYWLGIRLLAYAPMGQALGLLWGLVIAGALILKVRSVLQTALLEAAVEHAAKGEVARSATHGSGFCTECDMHLLDGSEFCIVCGSSVRATSHQARHKISDEGVSA